MKKFLPPIFLSLMSFNAQAADVQIGEGAPKFSLKNQTGTEFKLDDRLGKWTVLYFYPKSETPGCTKQACAFRDGIDKIRALGAEVFGVSVNSVADQLKFQKKHGLNFDLLADEKGEVTALYGAKMPIVNVAKRWTFIVDPKLVVRSIDKDVDPVKDVDHVTNKLKELQAASK